MAQFRFSLQLLLQHRLRQPQRRRRCVGKFALMESHLSRCRSGLKKAIFKYLNRVYYLVSCINVTAWRDVQHRMRRWSEPGADRTQPSQECTHRHYNHSKRYKLLAHPPLLPRATFRQFSCTTPPQTSQGDPMKIGQSCTAAFIFSMHSSSLLFVLSTGKNHSRPRPELTVPCLFQPHILRHECLVPVDSQVHVLTHLQETFQRDCQLRDPEI